MAEKYYSVRQGRNPGVYTSWSETQDQVNGFSGAIFKSFNNREDAEYFLLSKDNQSLSLTIESGLVVYTDGSYIKGAGGAGVVILNDGEINTISISIDEKETTNNRAEFYAITVALENTSGDLTLYTDSKYCIKCLTEWLIKWENNGWLTSSGKPVKNRDLIIIISKQLVGRKVIFKHVYGHTGNKYNEMADKLAREAAITAYNEIST